ncbi:MAG: transcription-repair coupling factor [Erysipelotrichaceae bacterium]|nr:transcription-repair coupling factor [Erysipelotrichaceae bacterium]
MISNILDLLKENQAVKTLDTHDDSLASLSLIEEALLIAAYFRHYERNVIVVKNNLYNAQRLYDYLKNILDDERVLLYGVEESLRIEAIAASPEMMAAKIDTMYRLGLHNKHLLITHTAGLLKQIPSHDYFQQSVITLNVDQQISIEELSRRLNNSGYQLVSRVDQPLTYAQRGGIIDVYSMNYDAPIRIEFFDDLIESIRYFDISTQRTVQLLKNIAIIPATDILFTDEEIRQIQQAVLIQLEKEKGLLTNEDFTVLQTSISKDLDYLTNHVKDNYLYRYFSFLKKNYSIADYLEKPKLILASKEEISTNLHSFTEENVSYLQELYGERKSFLRFAVFNDLTEVLIGQDVFTVHQFPALKDQTLSHIHRLNVPAQPLNLTLRQIQKELTEQRVLLCLNDQEIRQVIDELFILNLPYQIIDTQSDIPAGLSLCLYELAECFEITAEKLQVYSGNELFNSKIKIGRYANKFREAEILSSYLDLNIGDYVVHNLYGIGKYLGIVTKEIEHIHKDFLNIAYRGDDILLVPLEQFQLVRKFVSREGVTPKLNKLGNGDWAKTKSAIKNNVDDIAERLIELYAMREKRIGYAYGPDTEMQEAFEKEFAYQLTPDQELAVQEIKQDMMSERPMDRLLCGDVGFGKTEVAIRAAFKAVLEHKQVAFLCPTTILSHQHYDTFIQRFKNYPVSIGLLNRFVLESSQKSVLKDVKEAKIDILIGTHRILSKDIKFADLGLLIIDEEQRFGVEHKEKIKEIKQNVDVLSLSATPIPRTLQMSLVGIRALSQLNTPPNNRLPVLTYVIERNRNIVKEIIQRELVRNGQVFYLYNNVGDIYSVAMKIKADLPDAKVAVAHGKMHRQEIEDVMYRFVSNEYNVLICTTIIETGIDIPNANTMIIDNADRFGLSQLYQIKGRVGRSDRLAYAYLMYAPQKQLTEIAQKRLQSIKEFTELGSGYKIAMRDLTIRGAGDLLGAQQSGFIDTVGIDMYIEMLQEAIQEKQGITKEKEPEINHAPMNIDAYIPEKFTFGDYEKITIYQRIDRMKTLSQLVELEDEVKDMYGVLPAPVQLLFEKKRLEILIDDERIKKFKETKLGAEIVFSETWSSQADGVKLFEEISKISNDIELRYLKGSIIIRFNNKKEWLNQVLTVLKRTV